MRELADEERIRRFLRALGEAARGEESTVFLAGGATAVLHGWRATTIDVDIRLEPDSDVLLRAIAGLKNELGINVEIASPADFIPLAEGWQERSPLVGREGSVSFRHFELASQALAKLERGHERDLEDVRAMLERGLVDRAALRATFDEIEGELHRFPAIDPGAFRRRVEEQLA